MTLHRIKESTEMVDVCRKSILQHDYVSKKICQRCCMILYKMFEFRLDALKQNEILREKYKQLLGKEGQRLPNTCITIKKEIKYEKPDASLTVPTPQKIKSRTELNEGTPSTSKEELKRKSHPSVANIHKKYPSLKLPIECFDRHMAPVVSFAMGEVETYFRQRKLDMKKFIYKPRLGGPLRHDLARKATFVPEKQKTVAPLKISKKLLEDHKESGSSSDGSYVCTVSKSKKGQKRKLSSSSSEISVKSKVLRINQPLLPESIAATSKSTISKLNINETPKSSSNFPVCIPERPPPVRITSLQPADNKNAPSPVPSRDSRSPSPQTAHPLSDDSRDSFSTNVSTTSSLNKAEFVASFGLIPTVTATKSHKLLVCNLCGSVHHNAYELKKHTRGHMICQFCKEKFQSIEAKQYHIENSCQVKQIMNSSGPTVQLEKLHLNLDIRKKYKGAFVNFEVIPGLVEPIPVEHVILKAASPPPPEDEDNVIVLSDDDGQNKSADPLSDIPTPSANVPSPAVENRMYNTVSSFLVRPDIRIKNNLILNSLEENLTDKQLLRDLMGLFKSNKPATVETMSQTDLPANKDIKVYKAEGICELKNLKGQLSTYKMPITMSNGNFQVTFKYEDTSRTKRSMALWDDLPVIDATNTENTKPNTKFSTPSSIKMSQIQPLGNAVSSSLVTTSVISNPSNIAGNSATNTAVSNSSRIVTSRPATLTPSIRPIVASNTAIQSSDNVNINPINISNSATPLLQNYALNMTSVSVSSNPIPIPRTYINSALNNIASVSSRTIPSTNSSRPISTVTSSYNRSLPPRSSTITNKPNTVPQIAANPVSNFSSVSTALNTPSPNLSFTSNVPPLTLITSARPTLSHLPPPTSIYNSIPPSITSEPAQPTGDLPGFLSLFESRTLNNFLNKLPSQDPSQSTVISAIYPTTTVASTQLAPNFPQSTSINNSTSSITTVAAERLTIQTTDSLPFTSGNNSTSVPRPSEPSKFRVKSIWELQ